MKQAISADSIELRVDGGPTRNRWLMQFQSDILDCTVQVPQAEELSGIGAAFAAGIGAGIYGEDIFDAMSYTSFTSEMKQEERIARYRGWKEAVDMVLTKTEQQ
jgi:glycerol kinase